MKREELHLNQLMEAAKTAPSEEPESMPPFLKSRILAHWRASLRRDDSDSIQTMALLFRRALICAGVVMMLSIVWSFNELIDSPESEVAVANYEFRTDVMP